MFPKVEVHDAVMPYLSFDLMRWWFCCQDPCYHYVEGYLYATSCENLLSCHAEGGPIWVSVPIVEHLVDRHATLVEGVYPCNDKEYPMYIIIILQYLMKQLPHSWHRAQRRNPHWVNFVINMFVSFDLMVFIIFTLIWSMHMWLLIIFHMQ